MAPASPAPGAGRGRGRGRRGCRRRRARGACEAVQAAEAEIDGAPVDGDGDEGAGADGQEEGGVVDGDAGVGEAAAGADGRVALAVAAVVVAAWRSTRPDHGSPTSAAGLSVAVEPGPHARGGLSEASPPAPPSRRARRTLRRVCRTISDGWAMITGDFAQGFHLVYGPTLDAGPLPRRLVSTVKKPVPFGKYYLLERINVGGMAEVFRSKALASRASSAWSP
jgi:hypothetical protein